MPRRHCPTPACHHPPATLQIFLAQMSLDTKHNEIAKLEQRAHQREEALLVGAAGGITNRSRALHVVPVSIGSRWLHWVAGALDKTSFCCCTLTAACAQAAEQALEQDSQRFEEYLKENDAQLQVGVLLHC